MKRQTYADRLTIPLDGGKQPFTTHRGLLVAKGHTRVVIGGRGPYIEFSSDQIVLGNISIPDAEKHRLGNNLYFYDEYRSNDECQVKIYHQKKTVAYADYRVGMWYICPTLLRTDDNETLLLPIKKPSLFDDL